MGRRKIEIQPITHERNRSVTFLKRKNGLFKKAYELGVLCSVDVAVIIFETRPGHEVKLHEYSSSDIRNIVQRQTRHQGDTDLKVPADFSGSASKFDDVGDADGDDDDDDDAPTSKSNNRRRGQGRLTLPSSADDYGVQLPPPPPPAHHLHPESGAAALLSVANDRVSNMRDLHPARPNKRTRNARSRSPSEDNLVPALPAINSEWGLSQDNQGMGRYGRNIRHLQNPAPQSSGLSQQEHQHPHQQYHSMHQQQQHPGHGFQYTPLFPVSNQVSPPPAFIPLHQDFGSSRGLSGFANRPGGSGGGESGSAYADLHQRMRPGESPGYDPATYPPIANPMTRHAEHHHHHQQSLLSQSPPSPPFHAQPPAVAAVPHRREDRGADSLFGSLLEADERSRQRPGSGTVTGGSGAGLDWPMHEGLAPPDRSVPSGSGGPRGSLEGPGTSNPPNTSDSWFNDFLSRSNPINETQSSSGRRSSSSTWPRNNDNMDTRHNKTGDDVGVGSYDGKKESAVRGEGAGVEDGTGQNITVLPSAEGIIGEGDGGNVKNEDASIARSDADKT